MSVSLLEQHQKITSNASTNRNLFYSKKTKSENKSEKIQPASKLNLMQAVIESFVDGIFILTTQGELVHANERARCICHGEVPPEIRCICKSLNESPQLFPNQNISIESEINTEFQAKIRVRARWLEANESNNDYVIVTLEDRKQSNQSMAISEARKYALTEREAQVWQLRRANYSYQEIAEELYITINTVKKHLKNIYAKQQLSVNSYQLSVINR